MELIRNIRWSPEHILRIFKLGSRDLRIDIYRGKDPIVPIQKRYELTGYLLGAITTFSVYLLFVPLRQIVIVELASVLIFIFLSSSMVFIFFLAPIYFTYIKNTEDEFFAKHPFTTKVYQIGNNSKSEDTILSFGVYQERDLDISKIDQNLNQMSDHQVNFLIERFPHHSIIPVFISTDKMILPLLPKDLIDVYDNDIHGLRIKTRYLLNILLSNFPETIDNANYDLKEGKYTSAIHFINKYPLDNSRDPLYKGFSV